MFKKMMDSIKKNKVLVLAGLAAILLIVAIAAKPAVTDTVKEEQKFKKSEYVSVPEGIIELRVLDTFPPLLDGAIEDYYTGFPIKFTFSEPIALNTAEVEISPEIGFVVERGKDVENELLVKPEKEWVSGTKYTITIKDTIKSVNGNLLKSDYKYSFTVNKIEGQYRIF